MTDPNNKPPVESKARKKNLMLSLPDPVMQILTELSKEFWPFHRGGKGGNTKAYCEMVLMNHIKQMQREGKISAVDLD